MVRKARAFLPKVNELEKVRACRRWTEVLEDQPLAFIGYYYGIKLAKYYRLFPVGILVCLR